MKYTRIHPFFSAETRPVLDSPDERLTRLLRFAKEQSEYDCVYPHEYCLGVHPADLRHGVCTGCQAREALLDCGIPLDFDGIEMLEGDE